MTVQVLVCLSLKAKYLNRNYTLTGVSGSLFSLPNWTEWLCWKSFDISLTDIKINLKLIHKWVIVLFQNHPRTKKIKRMKNKKSKKLIRRKWGEKKKKKKLIVPLKLCIFSNKNKRKKKILWLNRSKMAYRIKKRKQNLSNSKKFVIKMNLKSNKEMKKKIASSCRELSKNKPRSLKISCNWKKTNHRAITKWF